jgi:hypothetical protein
VMLLVKLAMFALDTRLARTAVFSGVHIAKTENGVGTRRPEILNPAGTLTSPRVMVSIGFLVMASDALPPAGGPPAPPAVEAIPETANASFTAGRDTARKWHLAEDVASSMTRLAGRGRKKLGDGTTMSGVNTIGTLAGGGRNRNASEDPDDATAGEPGAAALSPLGAPLAAGSNSHGRAPDHADSTVQSCGSSGAGDVPGISDDCLLVELLAVPAAGGRIGFRDAEYAESRVPPVTESDPAADCQAVGNCA